MYLTNSQFTLTTIFSFFFRRLLPNGLHWEIEIDSVRNRSRWPGVTPEVRTEWSNYVLWLMRHSIVSSVAGH